MFWLCFALPGAYEFKIKMPKQLSKMMKLNTSMIQF
jgi:hypothetical protein